MSSQIVASVLGADYANLADELAGLVEAGVDAVQWDIMDGHFVPNLTFGADVVASARRVVGVPFEAHLMVEAPERWVASFVEAGCATVIVHAEADRHLHRTLSLIRDLGAHAGVALNPSSPLEAVTGVVDLVDLLVVMTVNPGFGGQSYLTSMEHKVAAARALFDAGGHDIPIEVDGGIKASTIGGAYRAGARRFIAGSAILGHPDGKAAAVAELRAALP